MAIYIDTETSKSYIFVNVPDCTNTWTLEANS